MLADQALALDPDNVDALNAKAAALRSQMQWSESEAWFERALAIDPNSAELLEDYAEFLAYTGRVAEALEVAERGVRIDPALFPLQSAYFEALLSNGQALRAQEEALRWAGGTDNAIAWWITIPVWLDPEVSALGLPAPAPPTIDEQVPRDWADTADIARRTIQAGPGEGLTEADTERLKSLYGSDVDRIRYVIGGLPRALLLAAGETDHVIATDLALFDSDQLPLHEHQWTPLAADLRAHPRFAEYLERIGLLEYWDQAGWPDFCRRENDSEVRCR